jgi:hypothetical protein
VTNLKLCNLSSLYPLITLKDNILIRYLKLILKVQENEFDDSFEFPGRFNTTVQSLLIGSLYTMRLPPNYLQTFLLMFTNLKDLSFLKLGNLTNTHMDAFKELILERNLYSLSLN